MGLRLRFHNVYGDPPEDRAEVQIIDVRTDRVVERRSGVSTARAATFASVEPGVLYKIRVFPAKHRPVGHFLRVGASGKAAMDIVLALHPDRVVGVRFPDFDRLDEGLQQALGRSTLEEHSQAGRVVYESLSDLQKAGLLNIWTKMTHTLLAERDPVSRYVGDLYRVRGDRFFANVNMSLRDMVKTATAGGAFKSVDGSLHEPPAGFGRAGSFKSRDGYGNLQLTFFASAAEPPDFKVDADIDDANGIEHLFQVLRNWLSNGATHPYDIHQILAQHQGLDTGYRLMA